MINKTIKAQLPEAVMSDIVEIPAELQDITQIIDQLLAVCDGDIRQMKACITAYIEYYYSLANAKQNFQGEIE